MTEQPEALRLADAIDPLTRKSLDNLTCSATAAELRRLHGEVEALKAALLNIDKEFRKYGRQHWPEAVKARAALDAARGQHD